MSSNAESSKCCCLDNTIIHTYSLADLVMTTRKGGAKDYKSQKAISQDQDYEINYYGDDNFLKTSAYQKEKNVLESRISELEWRNSSLEWKNRALTVLMTIFLLILLIGTVTTSILHEINIEQSLEHISELQRIQNEIQVRFEGS